MFGMFFVLTQYLQFVHGYTPLEAALRTLPFAITMIVVAPQGPRVVAAIGRANAMTLGMLVAGAGTLWFGLLGTDTTYWLIGGASRLLGGLILATGLGWLTTLITPPAIVLVIAIFAREGGLPWPFPALNTDVGFVLWNHLGFFGIAFLFHIVIRDALVE